MGHLPNSKHSKYGYKKAHIFTPTLGYLLLCETANIWNIFKKKVHILFTPTREHMQNSEHMKYWHIEEHILLGKANE